MLPLVSMFVRPLLTAVAPKFLKNLSDVNADVFVEKVTTFVNNNVTPIDENADPETAKAEVETAIQKIQRDPQLAERMLEMLIDAERDIAEKRIADLHNAREFRAKGVGNNQSQVLLYLSTGLLVAVIVLVFAMIFITPYFGEGDNKDLVVQLSGAAIGFLTGIGGMFARNIGSAFDFWFGSSVGSKQKSDQIDAVLRNPSNASTPTGLRLGGGTAGNAAEQSGGSAIGAHLSDFRAAMAAPT